MAESGKGTGHALEEEGMILQCQITINSTIEDL